MPGLPVKMNRHYNKHWSRPATRTYGYNHEYMSNYYRPMTYFLSKEVTYKSREGTPGAHSFAERIHKFPVYGGMYPDHEAAEKTARGGFRSSSLPPPAARRQRDATPVRGQSFVRGSSMAPGGLDASSVRAEASSSSASVRAETESSQRVESSQRMSRMESSSSTSSRRSRAETKEETKEMSRAERAVSQMREYLKNQKEGGGDKYVPLWKKHPYYLPVERIVVPPHEGSVWPEGRRHFDLVSSYDCMIDYLGIRKPE